MVNKKNIWFLTLFSLILVLSVYYITMPKELLLSNLKSTFNDSDSTSVSIEESDNVIETLDGSFGSIDKDNFIALTLTSDVDLSNAYKVEYIIK